MKRNSLIILSVVLMLCLCLIGCGKEKEEPEVKTLANFSGQVERVEDGRILVRPSYGYQEWEVSTQIWIDTDTSNIRVGDWVDVSYDGVIAETYPAQIHNAYAVSYYERILRDELQDQILETLSWTEVEFFDISQQNGVAVIGCQNGKEFGFVVLLKGEDGYSLEEVYTQSEEGFQMFTGVMESRTVYLVTDPDIYALGPVNENYDSIMIDNYPALIMPGVDTEFMPLRND